MSTFDAVMELIRGELNSYQSVYVEIGEPLRKFAIGDVQGCFASLQRLLKKINFDRSSDQLWFCGDLVNRGPDSLKTLRFIKELGDAAISVLGNHDLHLLAVANKVKQQKRRDTLSQILEAKDCEELLHWLRFRPLLYKKNDHCLVHAGIPPQWSVDEACQYANEVESIIRGDRFEEFLSEMYGNTPTRWRSSLSGWERRRYIVNGLTRIRYCTRDGEMDFECKGAVGTQPKHLYPWFDLRRQKQESTKIIFGHWSTLGFCNCDEYVGLDTGCVWGSQLTAVRVNEKFTRFSVDCPNYKTPK